jgi:hypothetical protein
MIGSDRVGESEAMMMTDTYTKIVMTVIALALVAIVAQQATSGAQAQFGFELGCDGSPNSPCFIRLMN